MHTINYNLQTNTVNTQHIHPTKTEPLPQHFYHVLKYTPQSLWHSCISTWSRPLAELKVGIQLAAPSSPPSSGSSWSHASRTRWSHQSSWCVDRDGGKRRWGLSRCSSCTSSRLQKSSWWQEMDVKKSYIWGNGLLLLRATRSPLRREAQWSTHLSLSLSPVLKLVLLW